MLLCDEFWLLIRQRLEEMGKCVYIEEESDATWRREDIAGADMAEGRVERRKLVLDL